MSGAGSPAHRNAQPTFHETMTLGGDRGGPAVPGDGRGSQAPVQPRPPGCPLCLHQCQTPSIIPLLTPHSLSSSFSLMPPHSSTLVASQSPSASFFIGSHSLKYTPISLFTVLTLGPNPLQLGPPVRQPTETAEHHMAEPTGLISAHPTEGLGSFTALLVSSLPHPTSCSLFSAHPPNTSSLIPSHS